ncbi:glycosyl transferase family 39 [Staphylothermus hellenicus DSM 12710]|uniref:Glycosyl transferase family 39 n=2 Tax=Staphylothermus hellenicus TaxID=84599 RepID=D7D8I0_STAHD|nr:glycosyl transferase family 39 [Staphylothermus hellenicus DSM 12710]
MIIFMFVMFIGFNNALHLYELFRGFGFKSCYVSDEVWYVSSARNILYKIFGYDSIRVNSSAGSLYTVVLDKPFNTSILNGVSGQLCFSLVEDEYRGSLVARVTVVKDNRSFTRSLYVGGLNAVYVSLKKNCSINDVVRDFNRLNYSVLDVIPGWALPDKGGINEYFNLEHPPLGKYFIMLSIVLLGDNPASWRIPSIVSTALIYSFSYLITYEILRVFLRGKHAVLLSLITPIIMYFDNTYHTVGVLAMLDPFLAVFTVVGVYVFIKYPYTSLKTSVARTVLFSLAGLIKFSGLFIAPAEFIEGFFQRGDILYKLRHAFGTLLRYYVVFPLLLILFSVPFINYYGFQKWFQASIVDAIHWHLSTKSIGSISSSPIDWLLGRQSFTLWINPVNHQPVKCMGLPIVYLCGFILGIITMPWTIRIDKLRKLLLSYYSIWTMYLTLYIIGNHSLWSFYIIHFSALPTIILTTITAYLTIKIQKHIKQKTA